jgi:hypothetical protein
MKNEPGNGSVTMPSALMVMYHCVHPSHLVRVMLPRACWANVLGHLAVLRAPQATTMFIQPAHTIDRAGKRMYVVEKVS